MGKQESHLSEIGNLIAKYAPDNGLHATPLPDVMLVKESESKGRTPLRYEPALILAVQGKKNIYLDGQRYEYGAGQFLALFMPMVIECELVDVSETTPLLGIGIRLVLSG